MTDVKIHKDDDEWMMAAAEVAAMFKDDDEWLTAAEVAAMFKVTPAHVTNSIAKIPGCEPIRLSLGKMRPHLRFHKGRLIAGLMEYARTAEPVNAKRGHLVANVQEYARNAAKEKTPG